MSSFLLPAGMCGLNPDFKHKGIDVCIHLDSGGLDSTPSFVTLFNPLPAAWFWTIL